MALFAGNCYKAVEQQNRQVEMMSSENSTEKDRQFFPFLQLMALSVIAAFSLVAAGKALSQVRDIIVDDGVVTKVEIAPGHTLTISTDQPFADVLIGNTDVIDVFPLTDNSLYIQSKSLGVTNVTLYSTDKKLIEVIDVRVRIDYTELERVISRTVPSANVDVLNVNNRIRVSGVVKDNVDKQRVLEIAGQFSSEPVIDALQVKAAQQVELDVRILEVERQSSRGLGVDLTGTRGDRTGNMFNTGNSAAGFPTAGTGLPFGNAVGQLLSISGVQIDYVINALEAKGLARRLANPKLVTTSGIEANFVVGGEVAVPVAVQGENGIVQDTEFKEYGVRLNFTPVVLDDELISLRIIPEVSDVDFLDDVPAFNTRRAETTVSLRNGQSFAIAGLLQARNERNTDQVPWLGQVPILGTLFSSRSFLKNETDLVILVTPRLVAPVGPDQPLKTPLDTTRSSNDVELFLLGMTEVDRDLLRRFREGAGIVGPYGHMIDLEFEDGVIEKK
ncbi:type II and III secretion system protein family protein [Marimonas lutisalis]|uniref:type II and III secretion system protein family protein n=1 Tax=Marimonas lutisalis TaxID=2545756 RepID=UPI001873A396|nr:type II and III secretion system protein family protein [Marimonas lutisalis]